MQFGFMLIALIWEFDFAPFMVLIIAILNDGKIISIDKCKQINMDITIFRYAHLFLHFPHVVCIIYTFHPSQGTIMTISKDRVKPSPLPDSWKLREIFATGVVLGGYLALATVLFFWVMKDTNFFSVAT